MKAAIDLHIHSALSPCADKDMTPNNIVNMACLKGLDIIALTDHNSAENAGAFLQCAKDAGILAVPGMELETREEVHLVCLFPGIDEAMHMQKIVYAALPDINNREDIFGQQMIMDREDNILGFFPKLLVTAADISIDEAFGTVKEHRGVIIPAHVDRESYSILSNLGMIPDNLEIQYLEASKMCRPAHLLERYPHLDKYKFITSSDAHYLWDISERENFLELEELSIQCLFDTLRGYPV